MNLKVLFIFWILFSSILAACPDDKEGDLSSSSDENDNEEHSSDQGILYTFILL